ncbi:hypothetical protein [Budvicia diplopodorum]|uniref:hypothetical protein n=1 Tax=Budvicia diplopodorum TaxID=1119056 RepID=UPI0014795D37|nr:hypothetical protein [Budvicia diplopodorum]
MTKYLIKWKAKAQVFTLAISMLLCPKVVFSTELVIEHIDKSVYTQKEEQDEMLLSACQKWSLDASQVKKIFRLSTKYKTSDEISGQYYWLPCEIKGSLLSHGVRWYFIINAAATAEWHNEKGNIYWGCAKKKCGSMFLLPYDGMAGNDK